MVSENAGGLSRFKAARVRAFWVQGFRVSISLA